MGEAIQIRAVLFKDGETWVAQCLEHDIGVQADDLDTLQFRLSLAIEAEAHEGMARHGEPFAGIAPAPKSYHSMWSESSGTFTPHKPSRIRSDGAEIGIDMKLAA